jgi:hypothetical protein
VIRDDAPADVAVTQVARRQTSGLHHHTCGTRGQPGLDVGAQPKIVSDRMGHANMSVTFQIYGHRSTGQDRQAADMVGGLIHRETARIEPRDHPQPYGNLVTVPEAGVVAEESVRAPASGVFE